MPSPFAEALSAMEKRLDTHMGERIGFSPMKNEDFDTAADPERVPFEVVGLADFVDPSSADIATLDARVPFEELEIEVRREVLPAGTVIRKNDQVELLERPGSPRYKVGRVDTSDPGRLRMALSKIGID